MPGPGPHVMYALGSGQALMQVSNGRFNPHHCLVYAVNAFFGPDMGSFLEWLTSTAGLARAVGSKIEPWIHDPFYYPLILGLPLALIYSWASKVLLRKGVLSSFSAVGAKAHLTVTQCFLLVFAGSLSHFFLDHLFEENGHSSMYTWILSTGWWKTRAPINPDAVIVVGLLCSALIGGFIYIYRAKALKLSLQKPYNKSLRLIVVIAILYCLWCASQIYVVTPRRPAIGEEADLGVLVFLGIFFFFPHWLCLLSMNHRDVVVEALPL